MIAGKKVVYLGFVVLVITMLVLSGCSDPTSTGDDSGEGPTPTASSDAFLSALGISDGTLIPGFQASIGTYSVSVSNSVENIGITPTANHASASIKVDGTAVPSGSVYSINPLNEGDTEINIVVTAEDGTTTRTYTVTVTRAAADSKDITYFAFLAADNAALSSNVSGVITEGAGTIDVTVPFGTDVTALVASFTATGTSVSIDGTVQTSAVTDNDFTGSLVYRVTASDTTTKDYTVTVSIASNDAKAITSFILGVAENAGAGITEDIIGQFVGFDISLDVPYNTNLSALVPTIEITGAAVSPASGAAQAFTDGLAVTYTVTASDTSTQDYGVTVNLLPSTDATLSSLTVSSGTLTPTFAPGTHSYTVDVANTVTSIDIAAAAADSGAAVTGDIGTVGLNVGVNNFTVTCTAEDGTTILDYTLAITRASSSDATLSSLSVDGTSVPGFDPGVMDYDVAVANNITSVVISATAADAGASVSGDIGTQSLGVGITDLVIKCTAADGTDLDYIISVTRAYATVTGTLSIPEPDADGSDFWVLIDDDTDGFNGYIAEGSGTWGSGTTEGYQIDNVPPGTYYILAGVEMDSTPGPSAGDYFGYYGGVDCYPPGSENAVVPVLGPVSFNFDLPYFPGGWTMVSGTLTLFNGEDASGMDFSVGLIDSLIDQNVIAQIDATWSSGSTQSYEIPNVPEGDYYLYTVIDWDGADPIGEAYPDYVGLAGFTFEEVGTFFATGVPPGPANVSIPSDGSPVTVDVDDIQQIPEAAADGTITVELTGAGAKAGVLSGFAVFEGGSGYVPGSEQASGFFIISAGGTGSAVAVDGDSNPVIFTGGTNYDIGFMIDDNSNGILDAGEMAGMSEGEVVNGNITVIFDYTDLDPYVP